MIVLLLNLFLGVADVEIVERESTPASVEMDIPEYEEHACLLECASWCLAPINTSAGFDNRL